MSAQLGSEMVLELFLQLTKGVKHMHGCRVIHRDLKTVRISSHCFFYRDFAALASSFKFIISLANVPWTGQCTAGIANPSDGQMGGLRLLCAIACHRVERCAGCQCGC